VRCCWEWAVLQQQRQILGEYSAPQDCEAAALRPGASQPQAGPMSLALREGAVERRDLRRGQQMLCAARLLQAVPSLTGSDWLD